MKVQGKKKRERKKKKIGYKGGGANEMYNILYTRVKILTRIYYMFQLIIYIISG